MSVIVAGVSVLFSTAAQSALESSASLLGDIAARRAVKSLNFGKGQNIEKIISKHVEATYTKCLTIKTLINPQHKSNLLAIYSTQRFSRDKFELDHYGLVEHIKNGSRNIIVTGTAGAGKSMFMRYLWASMVTASEAKIPIFVELKNVNNISNFDITTYLFHTLTSHSSELTMRRFVDGLHNGEFVIILDGFDELHKKSQAKIRSEIIDFAELYSGVSVIVSSRPDNEFASWSVFDVFEVKPMAREDTIELIEKCDFADDDKLAFVSKIKEDNFYKKNKEFLESPLLASMMLLAFSSKYDIPGKMHEFYSLAFDSLYKRHDSYKPKGVDREFLSRIEEDEFKRLLSYLCFISYYDEVFKFNRNQLSEYINRAVKVSGIKVSVDGFIHDLTKCVCILVYEGSDIVFSHRSFQEYFAACCLGHLSSNNIMKAVDSFKDRPDDEVVLMFNEMFPDQFRRNYIVEKYDEVAKVCAKVASKLSVEKFFCASDLKFLIIGHPDSGFSKSKKKTARERSSIAIVGSGDIYNFSKLVIKIKGNTQFLTKNGDGIDRDNMDVRNLYNAIGIDPNRQLIIAGNDDGKYRFVHVDKDSKDLIDIVDDDDYIKVKSVFQSSQMHEYVSWLMKQVRSYIEVSLSLDKNTNSAMDDFFGNR